MNETSLQLSLCAPRHSYTSTRLRDIHFGKIPPTASATLKAKLAGYHYVISHQTFDIQQNFSFCKKKFHVFMSKASALKEKLFCAQENIQEEALFVANLFASHCSRDIHDRKQ